MQESKGGGIGNGLTISLPSHVIMLYSYLYAPAHRHLFLELRLMGRAGVQPARAEGGRLPGRVRQALPDGRGRLVVLQNPDAPGG